MLSRRQLLHRLAATSLVVAAPRLALARAQTDARFVLVILRGAVDGLALAPPYGEGRYTGLRGMLALAPPGAGDGVLKLDGLFGLHPALGSTHALYRKGEASLIHAVASPYRERSHFDGQDILENGAARVGAQRSGWLNRAVAPLGGRPGDETAIALSQTTPLVLRGDNSVTSWAPSRLPGADDDTLRRLAELYADDEFFHARLSQALESQAIAGEMPGMPGGSRRGNPAAVFKATLQQAARFLTAPDGPRIAVTEAGGWDTHANQGAAQGALAGRLAALDDGLNSLRRELGDVWRKTVVAVVTEFGRTVRVNGTRGTDHGTAAAALVLGGAVAGGQVTTDWPGLAERNLHQGRDLQPTADIRSIFKGVLLQHLQLPEGLVEGDVFPDSAAVPAWTQLIRSA